VLCRYAAWFTSAHNRIISCSWYDGCHTPCGAWTIPWTNIHSAHPSWYTRHGHKGHVARTCLVNYVVLRPAGVILSGRHLCVFVRRPRLADACCIQGVLTMRLRRYRRATTSVSEFQFEENGLGRAEWTTTYFSFTCTRLWVTCLWALTVPCFQLWLILGRWKRKAQDRTTRFLKTCPWMFRVSCIALVPSGQAMFCASPSCPAFCVDLILISWPTFLRSYLCHWNVITAHNLTPENPHPLIPTSCLQNSIQLITGI